MTVDRSTRWFASVAGVLITGVGLMAVFFTMGLYYLAVLPGMWLFGGLVWLLMDRYPWAVRTLSADLSLVRRMRAVGRPQAARVVATEGSCALGYQVGDVWAIDSQGFITPPLCHSAVAPLYDAVWSDEAHPAGQEWRLNCRCPLSGRGLSLAIRALSSDESGDVGTNASAASNDKLEGSIPALHF